jgi:Zn-dependent protease
MSSEPPAPAAPLTAAGRVEAQHPGGLTIRREDLGTFRATLPEGPDLLALRPGPLGLAVDRRELREIVPWEAIDGLTLTYAEAGLARVPAVRVIFASGPSLDLADGLAPGADGLPASLEPGAGPLLRVERLRMLTAVVAACAGLAPGTPNEFRRAPRGVPVPPLATRPRVIPRWAPPLLLLASVAAIVFAFGVRWSTAVGLMAVIAVHELGHAVAMRLCGVEVRGFLFVPLLGAVTLPEHAFSSRWDEARVMLAGPVSGLPAAGLLVLLLGTDPPDGPWATAAAIALFAALAVNLFNLIPLRPLDGGNVLACLTAGSHPALRAVAAYAPVAVCAALALVLLPDGGRLAAAGFLGLSVAMSRATLRRQRLFAWTQALPRPASAVRASLRDVTFAFAGNAREDADGGVLPEPLSGRQIRVVLAAYFAEVVALGVSAWLFLQWCPWILDLPARRR